MVGFLAVASCCTSVLAGEQYFRWVDEQGTEVNSDKPPPAGVDYEVIKVKQSMTLPVADEETAAAPEDNPVPAPQQAATPPSVPNLVAVRNPEACAAARKNLETLNTFARIRVPDGNGSFRFIDEDEKAQRRAEAETAIAANCE